MSVYSRGWKYLFFAFTIALMAGCVNTKVVYKPIAPDAGGLKLPVKLAVLPFKDGTEDFTTRGNVYNYTKIYNLAKTESRYAAVDAMPPNFWAKAFVDDLSVSGNFQSVRFFYSSLELTDEDFLIEGTVVKANFTHVVDRISEFTLSFHARQRANDRLVWEKEVMRAWKFHGGVDSQEQIDQVIQDMFAEARADLVQTLSAQSWHRADEDGATSTVSPPQIDSESVDTEIEKILRGN
ncbi:MAG: hypothetical protein CVU69_13130 [Deltaproteobacteria bacterium HGW-Deltaproteobacteria-4]|nr:MAG: hypothetical protein CVU69_13130 [Deltaproteobacteria bacterium HGW-Deltaproteobacteria-4]